MKPITGTASNALEPLRTKLAGPPDTYLGVARAYAAGATVLATASPPVPMPLAHLVAHTLECLLRAYLCKEGGNKALKRDKKIRKNAGLRHNLNKLWKTAVAEGLDVSKSPPGWVELLSRGHKNFRVRYSTEVNEVSTPPAEPMMSELDALLEIVQKQIRGKTR